MRALHRFRRGFFTLAAAVMFCAGSGCSSTAYQSLISESTAQPWKNLHEDWAGRNARTTLVPTIIDSGPAVRVAVHQMGDAAASRTVVLIHGCFSDHAAWRFIAPDLARDHRLLLVDLPGCGASDAPSPHALGAGSYAPAQMAERVAQAIESEGMTRDDVTPITLVGHSLGATVLLRLLAEPGLRERHQNLLQRVDRAVLIAPLDAALPNPPAGLERVARVDGTTLMLAQTTGLLQDAMAKAQQQAVAHPELALREEADRQSAILLSGARRTALQAMLRDALPLRADRTPDWPEAERLMANYSNIDVPCLLVWGARDTCLPVATGYRLAEEIRGAALEVVPECMHSPQIEQPYLCAGLIREFGENPSPAQAAMRARQYARQMFQPPSPGETGVASVALGAK